MVGAALEADKMCRARKTKTSCVLSMPAEPFGDWHKWTTRYEKTIDWVPNDAAATWHRVLPTARDGGVGWDRRCSIWVDLHPTSGLVTQQLSRCAPHFVIAGAPKGGTTSLFAYLLQHPEIVRPRRKELRFFAPITRSLTRVSVSHATRLKYMNLFPHVDPRTPSSSRASFRILGPPTCMEAHLHTWPARRAVALEAWRRPSATSYATRRLSRAGSIVARTHCTCSMTSSSRALLRT